MSVINKMLRDLDSRHAVRLPGKHQQQSAAVTPDVTAGTVALGTCGVAPATVPAQRRQWMVLSGILLLTLVGLVAGWLGWGQTANAPSVSPVVMPQLAAQRDPKPVGLPSSAPGVVHMAPTALAPMVVAQLAPAAAVKPKSTGVTAVVPVMVPVVTRAAKEATSAQLAAGRPALPVSQPTPVLTKQTGPMTQSAHQGAMDILAQAQALWSQSDQVGALALVQGAITHLEQIPAADNTALANMAREHTRMALAMENPQAALSTLVRLESQLSTVADIWALRGNLNQRLGQHPRAVQAYLASLALRPNEPRWMLGAAVSLAIQGQIGPASEWTEKARLAGGLRTDVANYLRQLGVEIRVE